MRQIMLISSSVSAAGLFGHCKEGIRDLLVHTKQVTFVPFALKDWDWYERTVGGRFEEFGVDLKSIHHSASPRKELESAEAILIGGGNTFVLLREMQQRGLLEPTERAVERGTIYIGSSAGANLAGEGVYTTNDMPIVPVRSLKALNLLPVSINPHYLPSEEIPAHMGETRDERIDQFHQYAEVPVLAIYADSYIVVEGRTAKVFGGEGVRIFRSGRKAVDVPAGGDLDDLLGAD